jgi:hypothetical protein
MHEAYIGGPTGGVPEDIFSKRLSVGETPGQSGIGAIRFLVRPEICSIGVVGESETRFQARNLGGALLLDIQSRDATGQRHPDIYAGALVERFVVYAEEQGQPIHEIRGVWSGSSDNFHQYDEHLPTEGPVTPDDKKAAAEATWTGKLARSLGYDTVEVADERDTTGRVIARFKAERLQA